MLDTSTRVILPYIGTDEQNQTFQYLLMKITLRSALISIPSWLMNHNKYYEKNFFNLHLHGLNINSNAPIQLLRGEATPLKASGGTASDNLYRVEFEVPLKGHVLLQKGELEQMPVSQINEKILELIKDSFLLKRGVQVYLKHLFPFLSRIIEISDKRYGKLKEHLLSNIQEHLAKNINDLEQVFVKLRQLQEEKEVELFTELDLEGLREIFQSEIDTVLIGLAFDGGQDFRKNLEKKMIPFSIRSYHTYFYSIKMLEHRLYTNYNALVVLYSRCADLLAHHSIALSS